MGRFTGLNGVTFSVDDSKDERYDGVDGFKSADAPKAPAKKSTPSKSGK